MPSVWSGGVVLLLDATADEEEPTPDVPLEVARLLAEAALLAVALEDPVDWDVAESDEEDNVAAPTDEEDAAALEVSAEDDGDAEVPALLVARAELPPARDDEDGAPDEDVLEVLLEASPVPVEVHPAAAAPAKPKATTHTRIRRLPQTASRR